MFFLRRFGAESVMGTTEVHERINLSFGFQTNKKKRGGEGHIFKRLVYTPPDLSPRFTCKVNLSNTNLFRNTKRPA